MEKEKDILVIKKYSNRRLYNTLTSSYITINDLIELIKKNIHFKIVESNTNQDITRLVLMQLIFDLESKGYKLLPIEFLRHIINFYDDNLSCFFVEYLQYITKFFAENENEWRKYLQSYNITELSGFKLFEDMAKQNTKLFYQMFDFFLEKKDK